MYNPLLVTGQPYFFHLSFIYIIYISYMLCSTYWFDFTFCTHTAMIGNELHHHHLHLKILDDDADNFLVFPVFEVCILLNFGAACTACRESDPTPISVSVTSVHQVHMYRAHGS
jgi:hypothetical protein